MRILNINVAEIVPSAGLFMHLFHVITCNNIKVTSTSVTLSGFKLVVMQ